MHWLRWGSLRLPYGFVTPVGSIFFRDAGWTYLRARSTSFCSAHGAFPSAFALCKRTRRYLLSISALMVLWLLLRSIKYAAPLESVCRYLWYGYYLPLLFIPMFSLLVALSLGRSEDCRLPRWTRALYVAASILFLLVLTNERTNGSLPFRTA